MYEERFLQNKESFMPMIKPDFKELIVFRTWNASGWIKPMFYLSLAIIMLILLYDFSFLVTSGYGGWVIFVGVLIIILLCFGSVVINRIFHEIIMAFLQIPRLLKATKDVTLALNNYADTFDDDGFQEINNPKKKQSNDEYRPFQTFQNDDTNDFISVNKGGNNTTVIRSINNDDNNAADEVQNID
mmetsp:Transcript_70006/g.85910  ORF Transcript_70006/g.85910 Transcript_70006/m.85910 type:complete len:186 (-) Transcript_70006:564-1121(-)